VELTAERLQPRHDVRRDERLMRDVQPAHRHRHAAAEHDRRGLRVDEDVELGVRADDAAPVFEIAPL
jgi:hypothetical protein